MKKLQERKPASQENTHAGAETAENTSETENGEKKMSWIVLSRAAAEAAGANLKGDEIMYAITPLSVGEMFNEYRVNHGPEDDRDGENTSDNWGELTEAERNEYVNGMCRYIDKRMSNLQEDFYQVFGMVEKELGRKEKEQAQPKA